MMQDDVFDSSNSNFMSNSWSTWSFWRTEGPLLSGENLPLELIDELNIPDDERTDDVVDRRMSGEL